MDWLPLHSEIAPPARKVGPTSRRGAEIRTFEYSDSVLENVTGGIIHQDRFMPPARGARFNLSTEAIQSIVARAAETPLLNTTIAIGYRASWRNYYHWTTQCLLNTFWLLRQGLLESALLAVPPIGGFQKRSLDLLGIGDRQLHYVGNSGSTRATRFVVTDTLLASTPRLFPAELQSMATVLKSGSKAGSSELPPAIYISRLDSRKRRMRNEQELIKSLEKLGIEHVSMTGMTLDDQISALSKARLVIAPHGAGLTNILYSGLGTHLYELFPSSYVVRCYEDLSRAVGMSYSSGLFPPFADSKDKFAWMADIDEICRNTEERLKRISR